MAWLVALRLARFCADVTTTWKAIPSAAQRRHVVAVAVALLVTLSVAAEETCLNWYFSTQSVWPFRCDDALAWLAMVCVRGAAGEAAGVAADATPGTARVASAVSPVSPFSPFSAARPGRGRNVKALILGRIFILSFTGSREHITHDETSVTCSGDFLIFRKFGHTGFMRQAGKRARVLIGRDLRECLEFMVRCSGGRRTRGQ